MTESRPPAREGPGVGARRAWAVLAAALVAFAVFEVVKHGGLAIPLAIVGALGPDLAALAGRSRRGGEGRVVERAHAVLHLWVLPVLVMAYAGIFTDTTDEAAPPFTLGLTWLAHVATERAAGRGLLHAGRGPAAA